ncbi:hypothetical protein CJJ23_04885, partial [Mycoplasmopsis agassizii]
GTNPSTLNIKGTSDLAEFSPHFMSVTRESITNFTNNIGSKNVEVKISNFETYNDWKKLVEKVKTLWNKTEDISKLDTFSNALGDKILDALLIDTSLDKESAIFYVNPFPISELPASSYSSRNSEDTGQSTKVENAIGANKNTLILGGWQGLINATGASNENNYAPARSNGKPFDKLVTTSRGWGSYFLIDNTRYYFNGTYPQYASEGTTNPISTRLQKPPVAQYYVPNGESTAKVPNQSRYSSGIAVALRFLLEAVITNDTMSRTAENSEVTSS